ncbi:unnamed protein product [Rotaria sp. Silwood2]|nr:unnamed protein product [Rotaria sp. Silwood2]
MSDEKMASDASEIRETLEEISSDVTKKDAAATRKYDKNRRLTMKPPSSRHNRSDDNKSSDEGSSYGEPEDEDAFDAFILNNFSTFSGNENVIEWLDTTDEKFTAFKLSRKLRYLAIPLLVKGEAKRAYINNKNKINTYDDFYTFLLIEYKPINHNIPNVKSYSDPLTLSQSDLIQDTSIQKNVAFDDKLKIASNTFELNDSLPQPPILRSTALLDLGATGSSGDDPVNRSNVASSQNTFLNSSILDQTVYALRRAIVDSLIKNPKTFRGGKDDVKQWIEDIEQLFDTAQIPENHKLDLVQYSLRGEALRWFKNNKSTFISWKTFLKGLKETFLSPFFEEIAFKKLETYSQGVNQPVRSFYNEVIKLCNEADSSMSDFTKLRNLLNKTKPTLQLEIRKKKPTTTKQFLEYAIEVEELFHLSNIDIFDDPNKTITSSPITSAVTPPRPKNPPTKSDKTTPLTNHPENNYDNTYKSNSHNNNDPYFYSQTFVPSNTNYQPYCRPRRPWHYANQPFPPNPQGIYPKHNHPQSNNTPRTPYHPNYNQNNFPNNQNNNNWNSNKPPKNNNPASRANNNPTGNIPSLLDPLPPPPSFEICSRCGAALGKLNLNPSNLSLIFITTLVNNHKIQILLDTGATTTFINKEVIKQYPHDFIYLNTLPYSFVLADGIAPFHVHGVVELHIEIANQITTIKAHVAENLCTDLILGIDYIIQYNLKFDIRRRFVSIEHNNKLYKIKFDHDIQPQFVPVIVSNSIHIPSHSSHSVPVSTCISSICSLFVPHSLFSSSCNPLAVPQKFLEFHNYVSYITLSNLSFRTQFINQGTCLGYLCQYSSTPQRNKITHHLNTPCGAADLIGDEPVFLGVSNDKILPQDVTQLTNRIPSIPSTVSNVISSAENAFRELIKHVDNTNQQNDLLALLFNFRYIFDTQKHNIAKTRIHHIINTNPHSPPASKPYLQPDKEENMFNMIQEFLQAGLISESHSPYAAPAFLVKKKDGTFRLVVDYKKLNLITIKDSSPLPNMEDAIRKLGPGYQYFSKLDLKSGFYQIPIREEDKPKTAFITPFGLFQFNVLPMGLKNSPPTFQKVMTDTLKNCRPFSLVYLDDIIVYSKSYEEHLDHLKQVFTVLNDKNFVLNPPKCEILMQRINYLGHTIDKDTIKPMIEKIEAILNMKDPCTLTAANKFIGALSWYRKFIPGFASAASPIHSVTNLTRNNRRKFQWKFAQSQAFQRLKQMLVSEPLFLHYPVDDKPIILTTDASGVGIGGVLQQEVNGEMRNLYYHSQLLTPCERKYSTIEKEALAIFKCINRMRSFLLGRDIIIMTDHCPLCNIITKTVNNARVDRISNLIQEYNIIQVLHINGRHNCLPDYLSRYPREQEDDLFDIDYGLVSKDISDSKTSLSPKPIVNMILRNKKKTTETESISSNHTDNKDDSSSISSTSCCNKKNTTHKFSSNYFDSECLKDKQRKDPEIRKIVCQLNLRPQNLSFVLQNDILYKLIMTSSLSKTKYKVPYVPSSMVNALLHASHNDPMSGGHFSFERTYNKLKHHYWWPGMRNTIRTHIKSCSLCQSFNVSRQRKFGRLHTISPPDGPFQIIGIDYCGPLRRTPRGNKYVLVITDYFTRHVTAIPLPNCTAETTAESLFNNFFCTFGVPEIIVSDRGTHFQNQLMAKMQLLIGYNHIYSTPYHPQSNGIVERFNSTFISQISKLQDDEHNNWDEYLQAVVFAYNSGSPKTTKFSPYELVFGRSPRLPIHAKQSHFFFSKPNDYLEQLKKTMKRFHQSARNNILQQQSKNKTYYDRNRLDPQYKLGDRVLTRIQGMKGKLDPRFSIIPKVIIHAQHPTYTVRDEITKIESTVHVSDLRPLFIH